MVTWNPQDYAQNSAAQLKWARELIATIQFGGDESILDVGCGDGKITAEFTAYVPRGRVLGIDVSAAMIDYARATFPPERFPNLEFRVMDARAIEHDRRFDLVFSNAALHWVDDQRAVVLGVARILRPGGRLVISCGGRGNAAGVARTLRALLRQVQWKPYFEGFDFRYYFLGPEDYAPWLAESGFRARRLELAPKDMTHQGPEGLAAWIRTTWTPYTTRVPEALREQFIRELVEHYAQEHPADDAGQLHVAMVRLEVDAVKE